MKPRNGNFKRISTEGGVYACIDPSLRRVDLHQRQYQDRDPEHQRTSGARGNFGTQRNGHSSRRNLSENSARKQTSGRFTRRDGTDQRVVFIVEGRDMKNHTEAKVFSIGGKNI